VQSIKDDSFKEFVLDQLKELPGVTSRAMFGGYGVYQAEGFFGIIHQGRLYFKTNDRTRPAYVRKGMKPFRPNAKQTLKTYYEIPVEIIEDGEQLTTWAGRAVSDK
jgi:DNA transformation protein and related proteins